jgi:hypothetical protein
MFSTIQADSSVMAQVDPARTRVTRRRGAIYRKGEKGSIIGRERKERESQEEKRATTQQNKDTRKTVRTLLKLIPALSWKLRLR